MLISVVDSVSLCSTWHRIYQERNVRDSPIDEKLHSHERIVSSSLQSHVEKKHIKSKGKDLPDVYDKY